MGDPGTTRRDLLASIGVGGGFVATGWFIAMSLDDESDGETEDEETTETETPTFEADVSFPSCTSVTVDADSYGPVLAAISNGTTTHFEDEYTGENTFETDHPIDAVLVYGEDGNYDEVNPDYDACVATETETAAET